MELDLQRLFSTLQSHKVKFVLIGGLATLYHGSPFPTEDADIAPAGDADNLVRLAAALQDLKARIRIDGDPAGVGFVCDAQTLGGAKTWNLTTDAGDLDIAFQPSGTNGYADLHMDAQQADLYGATVEVASLGDVIRSKQAANRPKDQRVLPALRKLLARSDQT